MKKLSIILLVLLSIFVLVACQSSGSRNENQKIGAEKLMGTIVTATSEQRMVNGTDEQFAEVFVNMKEGETTVILADGSKGPISNLTAGKKIEVTFSGPVAMSMPPQVFGTEIQI